MYIGQFVKPPSTLKQRDRIQHSQNVKRSKRTRGNSQWLPANAFNARKRYLSNIALREIKQQQQPSEQNMDDLSNMMSMMQGNTANYISNIGFMFWVNSFFSGFLLVRLPFMLSETLRPLVQRDVMLQPFDTSYISSLSWYFISFFGLGGLNRIVLGSSAEDIDMKMMREQMGGMNPMMGGGDGMMAPPPMPGMGGQYNPNPMFNDEKNELKMVKHEWICHDAEKTLVKKWTSSN